MLLYLPIQWVSYSSGGKDVHANPNNPMASNGAVYSNQYSLLSGVTLYGSIFLLEYI